MDLLAFRTNPLPCPLGSGTVRTLEAKTGGQLMPRVYVGNLAGSVTTRDLITLFEHAGEVLGALAVTDRASGVCRGFGVVEMAELSDVAVAFSLLNNSE